MMLEKTSYVSAFLQQCCSNFVRPTLPHAEPVLHVMDTVDSTSLELRRRLTGLCGHIRESLLPHGYTVLAREQTQGRGRLNRVWHCSPGQGLMASFWLQLNLPAAEVAGFSLLPSLAVLDMLHELANAGCFLEPNLLNKAMCKWPNDIRVNGHKLCGILTECISSTSGTITGAIVGVGLNLYSAPPSYDPHTLPPVSLAELIPHRSAPELLAPKSLATELLAQESLAARLGVALMRRTECWRAGQRPALLQEWLSHCDHNNARLRVTMHGQKRWCHMRGLGPKGQLVVEMEGTLHEVWADDIDEG